MLGRARLLGAGLLTLAACGTPELTTTPWIDLEVHVTAGGAPRAGVTVRVVGDLDRPWWADTIVTDTHGVARTTVQAGSVALLAKLPGFADVHERVDLHGGDRRLDLALEPEAVVTGIVVDAAGEPAPGLRIDAIGESGMAMATTDAQGRFRIGGLSRRRYRLDLSGTGPHDIPVPTEVVPPVADLTLTLRLGGAILVELAPAPDSWPPHRVPVREGRPDDTQCPDLDRLDEGTAEWRRVACPGALHLDASRFRLDRLAPGTYRVMVRIPGVGARVSDPIVVGQGRDEAVRLELRPGRTLVGRIVDTRGAGAWLSLCGADDGVATEVHLDGRFSVLNAPEEEFLLDVVRDDERTAVRVRAGTGRTTLIVVLP